MLAPFCERRGAGVDLRVVPVNGEMLGTDQHAGMPGRPDEWKRKGAFEDQLIQELSGEK